MDLIIKPTVKCNFKCTFCSSTAIADRDSPVLDLELVRRFIKRFPNTQSVIINGGDVAVMSPDYVFRLIHVLEEEGSPAHVSITSNLYTFYLNPDKWTPLFLHPRVGVATSFQYRGRLKHDGTPYTEEDFWKVSDRFLQYVGYRPDFISVLTKESESDWLNLMRLARRMGVVCKLNYANSSGTPINKQGIRMGFQDDYYSIADAYYLYTLIYDSGYQDYEYNTQQLIKTLRQERTTCPLLRTCDEGIRCLQPEGDYYSCGSFGDDKLYPIDFEKEMSGLTIETPLQSAFELQTMNGEQCYTCPNFSICNGCSRGIHDARHFNQTEEHCRKMKALIPVFERIQAGEDYRPERVAEYYEGRSFGEKTQQWFEIVKA